MAPESARRGRPPAFDELTLLDATVSVIERNGLDATTLNDIAAEVGVTAMAVYRFCSSKDDLLARIPDFLTREIGPEVHAADDGIASLRATGEALGRVLDTHPQCAPLFHRPQLGSQMTELAHLVIERLSTDGLDRDRAAGVLRATMALVVGLRVTGGEGAEAALGPVADDALALWLAGVDLELER